MKNATIKIKNLTFNALVVDKSGDILDFSEYCTTSALLSDFLKPGSKKNIHSVFARDISLDSITELDYRCYFKIKNKILGVTLNKVDLLGGFFLVIIKDDLKVSDDANRFMCNLSREIKKPLNKIIESISLLSGTSLSDEQYKVVENLKENTLILLESTNDILDYSRLESGNLALTLKPFNLTSCVTKAIEIIKTKNNSKNIDISFTIDKDIPDYVIGDAFRIQQILLNLYSNSIKYTDAEGKISTKILLADSKFNGNKIVLFFSIKDTGSGIQEINHDLIFKSYTQLFTIYSKSDPDKSGIGIGLAICKELCYLMEGDIWLNNSNNSGTELCFRICVERLDDYHLSQDISSITTETFTNKKILLIDPENSHRFYLGNLLTKWGFSVFPCSSGEDSLFLVNSKIPFEVIILDITVYTNSETLTINKLKSLAKDIPIVAISGIGSKLSPSGKEKYAYLVTKPVKEKNIISALASIFDDRENYYEPNKYQAKNSGSSVIKKNTNILICSSNYILRSNIKLYLNQLGFQCIKEAINTSAAKKLLFRENYHLFFVENKDGIELIKCIRKNLVKPPFIIFTSNPSEDKIIDKEKTLFDEILEKPLQFKNVEKVLEKFLSTKAI
jgi:DNA-binding response OmpR family regulator/nitrogen-specific signal transduction histidine kinase